MGLTERHWFENEEPELTERQLEDAVYENKKAYERGYQKGYSDRDKEIIRCKHCKHGEPCKGFAEPYIECTIMSDLNEDRYHEEDWFCAGGEHK